MTYVCLAPAKYSLYCSYRCVFGSAKGYKKMMTLSECKLLFGIACTLVVIVTLPFLDGGWGGGIPANHAAACAMENTGGR